ncbi:MAG: SPFH domain-containing protein [Planctomycetota bacterium]|jgi:hypothetical protein
MGFFTDPCPACAAKGVKIRLKKGQRFCPECGAPGPTSEFECPFCGAHNKGLTKHCGSCGKSLFEEGKFVERTYLVEKTWVRDPDDFAARLHVQDVQGRFSKWVVVEEGTSALVFQEGQYAGTIGPGRHNHTGLAQLMAAKFNLAVPAVFVLVDSADVELEVVNSCLTSENLPVEVAARIVVSLKDPLPFFRNFMKSRRQIRRGELEHSLGREVETAVQACVHGVSIQEVVGNTKLRDEVLAALDKHLFSTLTQNGLRFAHVSSLTFDSEDLKRVVGKAREMFDVLEQSKAAVRKAEAEAQKLRGVDVAKEAQQEAGLKEEVRRQEMARAKEKGDLADKQHEVAGRAVGDDYDRDRDMKDQEAQLAILQKKRDADIKQWESQQEAELKLKQKKLDMYAAAPPSALAAVLDGPEFDRVMKIEELRTQEKLTPEQMLIFVAGKSPDVAKALAQKYVADGALKQAEAEKVFAEQKADMAKEMADKTVDRIADVAEGRARAQASNPCPDCGRSVNPEFNFCPYCKAKMKK